MDGEAGSPIEDGVRDILGELLHRRITPGENVSRESEEAWDSLMQVELLFALEDAFEIRFDEAELSSLASLDDFVASLKHHGAELR